MVASWPSSDSPENAWTASRSRGAPAAGPSVNRAAMPSRTRSIDRGASGGAGAARAASATVAHAAGGVEATRVDRRAERLEVRLARLREIERFERSGGVEQQRRGVAAAPEREHDLGAQACEPGPLEVVQRAQLGDHQQLERGVRGRRLELGLRGGERAPAAPRRVGGQRGRLREERGGRGSAAAGPRTPGRAFELLGHRLVGTLGRVGAMPGAAVGVELRVRGRRQRPVDVTPLRRGRRAVGGGAHQRVPEPDPGADLDQSAAAAGASASGSMPSRSAARRSSITSPTGSAAASNSRRRVSAGSGFSRRAKPC